MQTKEKDTKRSLILSSFRPSHIPPVSLSHVAERFLFLLILIPLPAPSSQLLLSLPPSLSPAYLPL